VCMRTQGTGKKAVVHAVGTSLSKMITKDRKQRLRIACRPFENGLEKVGFMYDTALQGTSGAYGQDLSCQVFKG
jgi:hypothetical protein